jgi:hypothetical protein
VEWFGFLSVLFEKMKCIFSIASVDSLVESQECFLLRNTHQTLATKASDTGLASSALWISVPRLYKVLEHLMGSCRMQSGHYFSVR